MKNRVNYYEKLEQFKENEKPEALLTIINNQNAIKTVIAWTGMNTRPSNKLSNPSGNSEDEIWTWLWDNTDYSLSELRDKLGIPLSETGLKSRLKPLIGNRILYPDGTINTYVQKYLREQVVLLFQNGRTK